MYFMIKHSAIENKASPALCDLLAVKKKLASILRHPLGGCAIHCFRRDDDFRDIIIWHCQISKNAQRCLLS